LFLCSNLLLDVVATTCQNNTHTLLTSAKLSNGLSRSGNYKRTWQGAFTALLFYLYKLHVVCATTIFTCPYVHASSSYPITHPHVFSLRPPCFLHVVIGCLEHEQFLLSFSFIFWLHRDFVFFFFYFGRWRGTWHRSHMTWHQKA